MAPSDPLPLPEAGAVGVAEDGAVVAVPAGHPLAGRPAVELTDLTGAYWIDAPAVAPLSRLPVDGLRAGLRYDGTDVTILTGLIIAGHGLALLPTSLTISPKKPTNPIVYAYQAPTGIPARGLVHRVELLRAAGIDGPAARLAGLLTAR